MSARGVGSLDQKKGLEQAADNVRRKKAERAGWVGDWWGNAARHDMSVRPPTRAVGRGRPLDGHATTRA